MVNFEKISRQGNWNALAGQIDNNNSRAAAAIEALENNRITGVDAYATYAELPVSGLEKVSYKVTNDPNVQLNGYYTYSVVENKYIKEDTSDYVRDTDKVSDIGSSTRLVMTQAGVTSAVENTLNNSKEYTDKKALQVTPQSISPESLSQETIDFINASGGGTIQNMADGKNLANKELPNGTRVITLANKEYNPENFSGKGRVYLEENIDPISGKNILTQEMISKTNTIYHIQYDYDVLSNTLLMPSDVILEFEGGSISNGSLMFNECEIINKGNTFIFNNIIPIGIIRNKQFNPRWLGAVGDGIADDTVYIAKSLQFSEITGTELHVDSGNYKITDSINFWDGEYNNVELNIIGSLPSRRGEYSVSKYGGLSVQSGTKVFRNADIRGSIKNVSICGVRENDVHLFNSCFCRGIVIEYCNITNFGAVFCDTSLSNTSHIINNKFLTVFWLAKKENISSTITDSSIEFNYINGGVEPTANSCFEWSYYNGSTISNNFIDYFRCIYHPKAISTQICQGGISIGNQYQVFRYFYYPESENISSHSFTSINDCFNWVDPESLEKLKTYEPLYLGSQNIELPPYIGLCYSTFQLVIRDAIIQSNIGNYGLYLLSALGSYDYSTCEYYVNPSPQKFINYNTDKGSNPDVFYNGGTASLFTGLKTNCYQVVNSLPAFTAGWSSVPVGMRVKFNNEIYIATIYTKNSVKIAAWVKERNNPNANNIGTTANRPATPEAGYLYFDTSIQKAIWWNNSAWVDSLGNPADLTEYNTKGTTEQRPILPSTEVGFQYYDTTLSKPIVWTGIKWTDLLGQDL